MTIKRRESASYLAAQQIEQRIRDGEWQPGEVLPSQRDLAGEMGISRTSLREALAKLESFGVVEIQPSKGVIVADRAQPRAVSVAHWKSSERYTPREVFQLRLGLERLAVELVGASITDAGIARLQRIIDEMSEAADAGNLALLAERDEDFHELLFSYAGNGLLSDMYASIRKLANASRDLAYADPLRIREPILEHQEVVRALSAKDGNAPQAIEAHIRRAAERTGIHLP